MSSNYEVMKQNETTPERNRELPAVTPIVDIYENDDEILLHADMPGVKKEDIIIHLDNGKLELSGTRRIAHEGATSWEEFGDVAYVRTFSVPQTIDVDKVHAALQDGVLKLHLPKSESARPRQIEVKAA